MPKPNSIRKHSTLLRQLLFGYWLASSLLIAVLITLFDVFEHQKQIVKEGEQIAQVVSASLRTPLTTQQRQQLLEAYGRSNRTQRFDRMNLLLVVDRDGRIVYTSRPAWRSLSIVDPLLESITRDDADFRQLVQCFRDNANHCMDHGSVNWRTHLSGLSVVRPVSMPSSDLGLPRRHFLVLANFDSGMLISDVLQDLPVLMLWTILLSTLLIVALWFGITHRLMPRLIEESQTDSLTQLINRTSFMELAMDLLAEAEEQQSELVFAILDIDYFKRINDTYGHGCGDAALASVGSLLLAVTRPEDLVCRFGGEEFALLLAIPRDAGSKALERLRLQLEMNTLIYNDYRVPFTASIGAAATSQCGYNIDFLYNAADKALYAAKHRGRNRLEWYSGELMSRLSIFAATGR